MYIVLRVTMNNITITEDTFGVLPYVDNTGDRNQVVRRFTMSNGHGMTVQVINFGATITSIKVPDQNGQIDDVVLGFDDIQGYVGNDGKNVYFGATIGRVCNRIAEGKFNLNGTQYNLSVNNGPNHLHGGNIGFDKVIWESHIHDKKVIFSYLSRDGEEGYPGDLVANVTYQLTPSNCLKINFQATVTKPTPVCLTNHTYFNLAGHHKANEQLASHNIHLNAKHYTPVDKNLIPTGEIKSVCGTKYDLRHNQDLHKLLQEFPTDGPYGYDENFCIDSENSGDSMPLHARVEESKSGRTLEVFSTQKGLQFYTANFLPQPGKSEPIVGKDKAQYWKHGAFCLEVQNYPNAINTPSFPSPVVIPGNLYSEKIIYHFTTGSDSMQGKV